MKFYCTCCLLLLVFFSCIDQAGHKNSVRIGVDNTLIDSLKNASDTNYSRGYPSNDFVKAEYYINHADTTLMQLMKDSNDSIRQVIITNKKDRVYFAQYYDNGQLMAAYKLDSFGQYDGESIEYYRNGFVQSKGSYHNGLRTGNWQTFDEDGKYKGTVIYNKDGQQEKIVMESILN